MGTNVETRDDLVANKKFVALWELTQDYRSIRSVYLSHQVSSCLFFFFFSSRRRHTRCSRDWSSDVCSSDLSSTWRCRARHRHVDEVARSQIDLGWTAGSFDDDEIRCGPQLSEGLADHGPEPITASFPRERAHRGVAASKHHDFRASVPERLHEHGIHPHVRLHPGRLRLERLGASDFAARPGDGGVVGDVLRLEWKNSHSPPDEDTTQRRHDERLPNAGSSPLDHEHAGSHAFGGSSVQPEIPGEAKVAISPPRPPRCLWGNTYKDSRKRTSRKNCKPRDQAYEDGTCALMSDQALPRHHVSESRVPPAPLATLRQRWGSAASNRSRPEAWRC